MGPAGNAWPRLARWCALLVAVMACWQVREVAEYDFVEFDDNINIVCNPHLGPWSRETLAWAVSDTEYMRRYVPVGWLGFSLVYGFSGLAPSGYHMAGAALHVISSTLVWLILLILLRRLATTVDDHWRLACATLAALGWSLHPLRAETVGWASGLFYGLGGCGALLSVLAYLRAWSPGVRRGWWLLAGGGLHLGAMLAYPMSVGVFGVFLGLDLALVGKSVPVSWRRLLLEKMALAGPVVVVVALALLASYHAPEYWPHLPGWTEFSGWARLQQAGAAWMYYLWRPWWPVGLTPVPTWLVDPVAVHTFAVASSVAVAMVSLLLIAGWRHWRGAALLWFVHASLLAPMLGFIERPYFPSDRYHNLAGVVLAVAVALVVVRARGAWRICLGLGWATVVLGLGFLQRAQLQIWTNTDTLMQRIVQRADHAAVRREYQQRWVRFHLNRGNLVRATAVAAKLGLERELEMAPASGGVPPLAELHLQLALAFGKAGRRIEAHEHYEMALKLAPDWNMAAYGWAMLHASDGAVLEALRWYRRAVSPGVGKPVPVAARQRLLSLIAGVFAATDRARLAVRTIELALRAGGETSAEPDLERQLRAQLAQYLAAAER